MCAYAA
jgi:hypothetical protein